jgi:hypothetical protein
VSQHSCHMRVCVPVPLTTTTCAPPPPCATLIGSSFPLSRCFRPLVILLARIPAAHQFLINRGLPFPRNARNTYIIASCVSKWLTAGAYVTGLPSGTAGVGRCAIPPHCALTRRDSALFAASGTAAVRFTNRTTRAFDAANN